MEHIGLWTANAKLASGKDEPHIRHLLLHALVHEELRPRGLSSEDANGSNRVRVRAEVFTDGRRDELIEQVTGRLSAEPGISAVGWNIADQEAVEA